MNLYKELNISKQATSEEIKKAYRKQALIHHPDRNNGKSNEKFNSAALAYRILSNSDKRKEYDDSGIVNDGSQDQANKILQLSVSMLIREFRNVLNNTNPLTILETNITGKIKVNLTDIVEKLNSTKNKMASDLEILSKIAKKLKFTKGKNDYLGNEIKKRICEIKQNKQTLSIELKAIKKAIKLADNYKFDYEKTEVDIYSNLSTAFRTTTESWGVG